MAMQFAQATEQFSRLYERSRPVLEDVYERSRPVLENVADRTKHLYGDAREWVPAHQGTVAAVSAVAVGACMLGYFTGRRSERRQSLPSRAEQAVNAFRSQMPDVDLRPFFRFVSLWMLYRVATRA